MGRKSTRLKGFDYSAGFIYFITICTHERKCLFGSVESGAMSLNAIGEMVSQAWVRHAAHIPGLVLDEFVLMPNHMHAVLGIVEPGIGRGHGPAPTDQDELKSRIPTLPDVVRRFKIHTLAEYKRGVLAKLWKPYSGKLWQRGYWDHVIRNDHDLEMHREYIYSNPLKWHLDRNNPASEKLSNDDLVP